MVPKILFLKNSISQLSNAVSTVPIALLDQKLQPEEKKSDFKMYFYFREIYYIYTLVSVCFKQYSFWSSVPETKMHKNEKSQLFWYIIHTYTRFE